MSDKYQPPFHMTEKITNLIVEIGEHVGAITTYDALQKDPVLRRENRIRSIHSSLAIEQNTLSLEQVTDVIAGKRVLAPPQDIHEVKNAYDAYEAAYRMDPYSVEDLLKIHRVMMEGLVNEAGIFRNGNVGVFDGDRLIHAGTPAKYVPDLVASLFSWLKESDTHPLLKSSIFHYEFEFIHPFADGNGRMGRLWQSLILAKWNNIFEWIPVETMVHEHQQEYYDALNRAGQIADAAPFVELMLEMISTTLAEIKETQRAHSHNLKDSVGDNVGNNVGDKILALLKADPKASAKAMAVKIGISDRQVERVIKSLREEGRLVRHGSARGGHWEIKF